MKIIAMPASACRSLQQRQHLRLDGDVERGGRLVGDQHRGAAGDRHGDHHALAHAAGELVRIGVEPACRRRACRTCSSSSCARARAWPRPRRGVGRAAPRRSAADRGDRIERAHRVLEDHADLLAPDAEHRLLGQRHEIASVEDRTCAADDAGRRIGQQAHDRQRRQRLAAARFADQRHGLARADRELTARRPPSSRRARVNSVDAEVLRLREAAAIVIDPAAWD